MRLHSVVLLALLPTGCSGDQEERDFWAQQFWFDEGDGGFLGLQDRGLIDGAWAGKIVLSSVWDSTEATPGDGASCEPFDREGEGVSCRRVFDWQPDTPYTFVIAHAGGSSWSVSLTDPRAGEVLPIGTITVPASWGGLEAVSNAFAAYDGGADSCDDTPYAQVIIHTPSADGVAPESVTPATYGTCADVAQVSCVGSLCG